MKITVAIITRNRPKEMVACIQAFSKQSNFPTELIILDSSDEDETKKIIRKARKSFLCAVRYVREPRVGYSTARNKCLSLSRSDWVVFLDDDCYIESSWFWRISKRIRSINDHKVAVILGKTDNYYPNNMFACAFQFSHEVWLHTKFSDSERINFLAIDTRNTAYNANLLKKMRLRFNSKMEAGGEDIDMAIAIRNKGYRVLYDTRIVVFHKWPSSLKTYLEKKYQYFLADRNLEEYHTTLRSLHWPSIHKKQELWQATTALLPRYKKVILSSLLKVDYVFRIFLHRYEV